MLINKVDELFVELDHDLFKHILNYFQISTQACEKAKVTSEWMIKKDSYILKRSFSLLQVFYLISFKSVTFSKFVTFFRYTRTTPSCSIRTHY